MARDMDPANFAMLGTPCGTPSPQPLAALLPQPNSAPDPDTPGSGSYNCQSAPLSLFSLLLAYQQWRVAQREALTAIAASKQAANEKPRPGRPGALRTEGGWGCRGGAFHPTKI
jgi:hypothetical protein